MAGAHHRDVGEWPPVALLRLYLPHSLQVGPGSQAAAAADRDQARPPAGSPQALHQALAQRYAAYALVFLLSHLLGSAVA